MDELKSLKAWEEIIFNSSLQSSALCIALFSIEGKLLFANKAMDELLITGTSRDLINPDFDKLLSLKETEALLFSGILTLGNNSSSNTSIDAKIFRKNNELLIIGEPDVKQLVRLNEITRDLNAEISDLQRQLIKEKLVIERTNKQLLELNTTKDKLFTVIAHDLKSPFSGLLGLTEEMVNNLDSLPKENISEYALVMNSTIKKLYDLLVNLLDWSRFHTGKMEFRPIELNLFKKVASIIELYSSLGAAKEITIQNAVSTDDVVFADKNMLSA
ncbi:MAG: sensor histidine kinase, partial [Methanococcaceae archaeon]